MTRGRQKRVINEKKRPVLVPALAVLILLAGVAFLGWKVFWSGNTGPAIPVVTQQTVPVTPAPAAPADEQAVAVGGAEGQGGQEAAETESQRVARLIREFFQALDGRDYVKRRGLQGKTLPHSAGLVVSLLANPPQVVGEKDSIGTVLANSVHFFRVLKKENLLFVRDVLSHERAALEDVAALFYRWMFLLEEEPALKKMLPFDFSLPACYEYAGFFLNTLGGQSYLFRRESGLRALVRYYSVLIIDQANDRGINRHGLDIRPFVDGAVEDLRGAANLRDRDAYLEKLVALQAKYAAKYGGRS